MIKRAVLLSFAFALLALTGCREATFESMDRNRDGKITISEVPASQRDIFYAADRDESGSILPDEFAPFVEAIEDARHLGRFEVIRDIPYADTDNPHQRLDLILPKRPAGKLPLIVYIHGGGWVQGDKNRWRFMLLPLLRDGNYAAASIAYRLSPEAPWPAQIHDCKAAVRWLRANAPKYGIDPDRIAVFGHSAGGHLAAMIGLTSGIRDLDGGVGRHTGTSSRPSCVVDYAGPSELVSLSRIPIVIHHTLTNSPVALLLGCDAVTGTNAEIARAASPVSHAAANAPPFLIAQGDKDSLVPFHQSELLYAALTNAHVAPPPVFIRMVGADHVFFSAELNRRTRQFLDMHLRGRQSAVNSAPIGDERK